MEFATGGAVRSARGKEPDPFASDLEAADVFRKHGDPQTAAALYRQILRADPFHFDALHNLGLRSSPKAISTAPRAFCCAR